MTTYTPANEPFLKHLAVQHTPYLFLTAETDDFDQDIIEAWANEGFSVTYVPLGDGGAEYTRTLHSIADSVVGLSDHYAIVAFGDAASVCLEAHIKSRPRLCALIAYYPSTIPDPNQTKFPMATSILVHLVGDEISVRRTPEILGIQGKRRVVRKRVQNGLGIGGELKISYPSYKYEDVEAGFAEHDLEEYDAVAEGLAWTRSLGVVRRAFGMYDDIERTRDQHLVNAALDSEKMLETMNADAQIIHTPTLTGGIGEDEVDRFYADYFSPSPWELTKRLLSRTVGIDRVVDELYLSFVHNKEIDWLLPGVEPTNKRVEVILVSIICVRGGKLQHEHVYWDQASVLVQVGLLDPKVVPEKMKDKAQRLPVAGAESARAVLNGRPKSMNGLIPDW